MTLTLILAGLAILLLLILSGLFSGTETALTAANRARLHQLEKDGDKAAARVNRLRERPEDMLGALLLGNNLVNILASSLATFFLTRLFGPAGVAIAAAVMTALVLVFAEVLPKTLAITRPEQAAMRMSFPATYIVKVLSPAIWLVQTIVRRTLRMFGVDIDRGQSVLAHDEIRGTIEVHHEDGLMQKKDRDMLGAVLDLTELSVADIMVHRKSISTIDATLPTEEIIRQAMDAAHTRLPLWENDQENIIGILHAKDLLKAIAETQGQTNTLNIRHIMREPWFVPETTKLKDQLNAFLKRKAHNALVVDEYGALMGLVTLEDILEEIVGEIDDEHDVASSDIRKQADESVNVDGTVTIRDLNRAMDWNLPDDDAVTIAGLVIHEAQTIPEPGQVFVFHGHRFQILRRRRNQITALKVRSIK